MNLQTILNSTTAVLLLFGLAVLFVNVIVSAVRLSRGHVRTGIINVALVLMACAVITVGLVRIAFPTTAGATATGAIAAAPVSASGNASSNTQSASQVAMASDRNVSAGAIPSAPNAAPQGQGGFPAPSGDQAAPPSGQAGQSGRQTPQAAQNVQSAPSGAPTANVSTSAATIPSSRLAAVGVIGGALILLAGLILYFGERRKQEFLPSASAGLLYVGAGIFVLVAALALPGLGQTSTASAAGINVASLSTNSGPVPTRAAAQNTSPMATPTAVAMATEVPTLTPIPSATPTALFTAIAYAGSTEVSTTTTCSVTPKTALNLRGDPSTRQMAIGKVFAGSLLPVTGQSADKKWWRVISSDGGTAVEGWVSADYVTTLSGCANASIPTIDPTPTATPRG